MSDSGDTNKPIDSGADQEHLDAADDAVDNADYESESDAFEDELDDNYEDDGLHDDEADFDSREEADSNVDSQSSLENNAIQEQVVKRSGAGLSWLALLLALVASGLSGYIFWQQTTQGQARATEIGNNQLQLTSMSSTLSQQESQVSTIDQRVSDAIAKIDQSKKSTASEINSMRLELKSAQQLLDSHARRLLSLTATTTDDWRIAEVDYLLRLANQRVLISRDGATAITLLEAADKILLELGDPRLFDVRKAVAEDKAALSVVSQVDTDGIFLSLAGLIKQVDQLPIISTPVFERELVATVESIGPDKADRQLGDKSLGAEESRIKTWYAPVLEVISAGWNEVRSWLVINKQDAEIKPLLPPEQQYYLRGNLKILLNQAQLALLESKKVPYTTSLNTAIDWIERHFPMEELANQRAVAALEQLSQINIVPEYPDLTESLLTVKAFIHGQHAQVVETSTTSDSDDSEQELGGEQ